MRADAAGSAGPEILRVSLDGRRFAALIDGAEGPLEPKTAAALARFRPEHLAALVHRGWAGRTAADVFGPGSTAPVVADLEAARAQGANAVLVGTAPIGGELPAEMRADVRRALEWGWDAWSGLHTQLADDAELRAAAERTGAALVDLRRVPESLPVASGQAAHAGARIVLTVGSDCNVGKMTVAWEVTEALRRRGRGAAFVATGQTGILLSGWGLAVDRMRADFVAGAAEALVLEAARTAEWAIVEGQGSLVHPGYSGVTLSLMHGAMPELLILCHDARRTHIRHGGAPIPSLERLQSLYEEAAEWVRPARVVAVALNTHGLDATARARALAEAHAETGLPAGDVLHGGAEPIAEALLAAAAERLAPEHAPATSHPTKGTNP